MFLRNTNTLLSRVNHNIPAFRFSHTIFTSFHAARGEEMGESQERGRGNCTSLVSRREKISLLAPLKTRIFAFHFAKLFSGPNFKFIRASEHFVVRLLPPPKIDSKLKIDRRWIFHKLSDGKNASKIPWELDYQSLACLCLMEFYLCSSLSAFHLAYLRCRFGANFISKASLFHHVWVIPS